MGGMLAKLPNNSWPNSSFREKMLRILIHLPVEKEHLEESTVGKILVALEKSPEEIQSNRQLIRQIKDKWSRVVCNLRINYSELEPEEIEQSKFELRKRQQIEEKRNLLDPPNKLEQVRLSEYRRAIRKHDFVLRPKSTLEFNKSGQGMVSLLVGSGQVDTEDEKAD